MFYQDSQEEVEVEEDVVVEEVVFHEVNRRSHYEMFYCRLNNFSLESRELFI